jgi:hypothetical protein
MIYISHFELMRMENESCDRSFLPGEIVMNEETILSTDRRIQVFREKDELKSNDIYNNHEIIEVTLSDVSGDILFETDGKIIDGGCDGKRSTKHKIFLEMPSSNENVRIWAGIMSFSSSPIPHSIHRMGF